MQVKIDAKLNTRQLVSRHPVDAVITYVLLPAHAAVVLGKSDRGGVVNAGLKLDT